LYRLVSVRRLALGWLSIDLDTVHSCLIVVPRLINIIRHLNANLLFNSLENHFWISFRVLVYVVVEMVINLLVLLVRIGLLAVLDTVSGRLLVVFVVVIMSVVHAVLVTHRGLHT
jgi:hypothetical protein